MIGEYYQDFKNLKGVFIWAEEFPELVNHIFVLFRTSTLEEYRESLSVHKNSPNFEFSYTPDKFYDMLVFKAPSILEKDYTLLKNGKYSEISDKYKRHIIKFHNITNGMDDKDGKAMQGILYKTEQYRQVLSEALNEKIPMGQELASLIDPLKETYLEEMKVVTKINNLDLM